MTSSLCVTVSAPTMEALRRRRDEARDADLVELRLDGVANPNVAGALAGRRTKVIVTCRPTWEGGRFDGSEEERKRLLSDALALGADFVDVEWRAHFDDLVERTAGRRIVLSRHDFDGMPADLADSVRQMRATGAEVVKIAVKPTRLADCVRLDEIARAQRGGPGLVLIGMGERGLVTRVLASRFGSPWTYAGELSDVGQVTASTLTDDFHFRSLRESTSLYGVVGSPIGHSVSPAMHNAAIRAAGVDAVYLPLPAADLEDFIAFGRSFELKGASVTIPFKVALLNRVDEVDDVARRIGAVNTVKNEAGRWIGANTDAEGLASPIVRRLGRRLDGARPLRASILGAGGAARAAAVVLTSLGAAVTVHARKRDQAEAVAALAGSQVGPWPPAAGDCDLLINCTPIGMHPHESDTPMKGVNLAGAIVYDLVYNPPRTRLLRDAEAAGCQTIGGLEMLVRQAEEQFHWWFGCRPAAGVMREAAERRLSEFAEEGALE